MIVSVVGIIYVVDNFWIVCLIINRFGNGVIMIKIDLIILSVKFMYVIFILLILFVIFFVFIINRLENSVDKLIVILIVLILLLYDDCNGMIRFISDCVNN